MGTRNKGGIKPIASAFFRDNDAIAIVLKRAVNGRFDAFERISKWKTEYVSSRI